MSENWTREHMVSVYGEAGADAMRKLSDAYARIEELEALLREAYEEDHQGHRGPVGDLGERIFDALGDAPVEPEPTKNWRCEVCNVPAVPAPGHTCWDAGHPHVVQAALSPTETKEVPE